MIGQIRESAGDKKSRIPNDAALYPTYWVGLSFFYDFWLQ